MTSRLSNLDSTRMRLVRKGCRVAFESRHYLVTRVRLGEVYMVPVNAFGTVQPHAATRRPCAVVQVVA